MRTIDGIYTSYTCCRCKKNTILISEEVSTTLRAGKYISCSHCGSDKLIKEKITNNLKECMGHSAYRKVHGAIRQVRQK